MRNNYPDSKKISEVKEELRKIPFDPDLNYYDYEQEDKRRQLHKELEKLVMGEPIVAPGKTCKEKECASSAVYYPGKVHHVDGDIKNDSFNNLAMVCPECKSHILLSRFSPEEIWLLKAAGLSNAKMGRIIGMSRERVRQILSNYKPKNKLALDVADLNRLSETHNVEEILERYKRFENILINQRRIKRRADKRTVKKHIKSVIDRSTDDRKSEI